ncbi:hypothetical protein TWF102_007444 [Orbilia oligospora]|uniref:MINDY deubiquitinase domain-containing protein n=1 Tax=Orbilia oligospora TaxID=2813651 RepID=A0A7C8NAG3_ORBOL|nr:hypothetical protein TWF102_007444 [Orbilia oligospora]KAF3102883.1 hypothetical protein TWF103_007583 [Orbilia oligospora]
MVTVEQTSQGAVGDPFGGPIDESSAIVSPPPTVVPENQSHLQPMPMPPVPPPMSTAGNFNIQPLQDSLPDNNPYRQLQKQRTGQSDGSYPGQPSYLSTSAGATTGRPGTAPYLSASTQNLNPQPTSNGFMPTPPSSYHASAPRSHSVSAIVNVVPQPLYPISTNQDGVFHMDGDSRPKTDPFTGEIQPAEAPKSPEWWESPVSTNGGSPTPGKPHLSLEEQLENEFHRGRGTIAQQLGVQVTQPPPVQQQPIQLPLQYPVPPVHQPLQQPVPQSVPQPILQPFQSSVAQFAESDPFTDLPIPPKPPTPPKIPHGNPQPSLLDAEIKETGTDKQVDLSSEAPIPVASEPSTQSATAAGAIQPTIPLETYQIKHIRFLNPATNKLAQSSILIQNENGPCPLIALINVLSLSRETLVLSEGLRIRETLSLELLLNVVCEELVLTGSWTGDLSELFKFLLGLRTGMNVNPKFVNDQISADDFLRSRNVHENRPLPQPKPGDFEQTRELILYSAFNIPLVHGWLPAPTSPTFPVLVQYARDFEKAQDIIIQQQFILEKGSRGEQISTEDNEIVAKAHEIQDFLEATGTQMTAYGLNILQTKLAPGSWSIFFRNDHFSTLYKHQRTGDLYTLVTDSGYASYEEIVWESLVDASGRGGEYFSGDFRPVGHGHGHGNHNVSQRQSDNILDPNRGDGGWQPQIQPRQSSLAPPPGFSGQLRPVQSLIPPETAPIVPPNAGDTTDYDLALAIHLQQEEEERAARTQQNRQNLNPARIQNLASANQPPVRSLVSSQPPPPTGLRPRANSASHRPAQPPRPTGRQAQELRNAANNATGEEIPPPYAAADPNPTAFTPQPDAPGPGGLGRHSSFPTQNSEGVGSFTRPGQTSAYSQMNSLYGQSSSSQYPGAARGRKPGGQSVGSEDDKKCSIM